MENSQESRLGRLYRQTYEALCGKHPHVLPWHFQWLDTIYLARTLKARLPQLGGRVLDVGCGDKPYRALFSQATDYVGIDVVAGGGRIMWSRLMRCFLSMMGRLIRCSPRRWSSMCKTCHTRWA